MLVLSAVDDGAANVVWRWLSRPH